MPFFWRRGKALKGNDIYEKEQHNGMSGFISALNMFAL